MQILKIYVYNEVSVTNHMSDNRKLPLTSGTSSLEATSIKILRCRKYTFTYTI